MRSSAKDKQKKEQLPYCKMLEDVKEITGRNYSEAWEIETVKMINIFKLSTAAGQSAISEHWFGHIYDNYIVAPYGLANYLFEIYSKYIWVKDIVDKRPDWKRPSRPIEEFNYTQNHKFREWVDGKYFYAKAKNGENIDIVKDRRDDLIILRKIGIERWKTIEGHMQDNPDLLKTFLPKDK